MKFSPIVCYGKFPAFQQSEHNGELPGNGDIVKNLKSLKQINLTGRKCKIKK